MRFKLDENLDVRLASLFEDARHEAKTVLDEGLSGRSDEAIYAVCLAERRILITLDLDFSNPIRFPPAATEGIVILRPSRPVIHTARTLLQEILPELTSPAVRGKLWIVEPGRLREYDPSEAVEH